MRAVCCAALAACLLSGCSIRPVPQDFAHYDSFAITETVRCETRQAIAEQILAVLDDTDPAVARRVRSGEDLRKIPRSTLSKPAQDIFNKYDQAAIVYEFTFDITEKNNLAVDASLLETLGRGPLTIGMGAGSQRERANLRNFRAQDTFESLVTRIDEKTYKFCKTSNKSENWIYPITGSIGMSEMIDQFLKLNEVGALVGDKENPKVPYLADTLRFTTTVTASASPKVVLSPLGRSLDLASAGITADATRQDVHKVIIVISLPEETIVAPGAPARPGVAKAARASALVNANRVVDYQNFLAVIARQPIVGLVR